ncbi:MAG: protein-disulfide reductase DsbD N-terminal domain-containing protein [Paramuribaculum sp.]|nr:protein-disulfide reductase DsbD N-terminal domain-containing protein [Paramuribaculum sp.]
MFKIKSLLLLFVAIACSLFVSAQKPTSPASWRLSVKMVSENDGVAVLKATVSPGWHLYGTSLPKGGPKPTVIDFDKSEGVEFYGDLMVSQAPKSVHDKMFNLDLNWWDSDVSFRKKFHVVKPSGAKITATVQFMGCNDVTCAPPASETISKPVVLKKK